MKKIFIKSLLILSVVLIASCSSSSDDDGLEEMNSITMTLNGESLTFNNLTVNTTTDGGFFGGPTVEVTGIIGNSTTRIVTISLDEGATGSNSLNSFQYVDSSTSVDLYYSSVGVIGSGGDPCGNTTVPMSSANFVTSVNDGTTASGNFSLTIYDCVNDAVVSSLITNGSFNASY